MRELSLNILDIAQNSVRAGAAHITVSLAEDSAGWLTLSVIDDGCGMSAETVRRVMDPFYTTRTTRKVGLGVPLLRLAAEQTGGELTIRSVTAEENPGKHGTELCATFDTRHIDFEPLGDIVSSVCALVQGQPQIDWVFTHTTPAGEVRLDCAELREVLGGVPLSSTEVINWIRDYLDEQYKSFSASEN